VGRLVVFFGVDLEGSDVVCRSRLFVADFSSSFFDPAGDFAPDITARALNSCCGEFAGLRSADVDVSVFRRADTEV
jgi:hypothetical protein